MSTYKDRIASHLSRLSSQNVLQSFLDAMLVTSVPLTLLLLNQSWIFATYYNLDEWMYIGYGYNYFDPGFYAENYKISRLPWVLTEVLVRGSFPPLVSSWIIGFGILALGNTALYLALKIPFGRLPALFASILIAGLIFMHANGGADYHNTLAGAFYCLAMLFCSRCARQELPLRDLVFFGASIALSIHTNPLFINLAPILFAQYLLCYRVDHLKFPSIYASAFLPVVGAVAVTIMLGLINLSFGRQFLFFAEQYKLVSSFIADSSLQKQWWEPWSSYWFLNIEYMGVFFAGTLLSVATLVLAVPLRSLSARYAYASIYSSAYLCSFLIWIFWQSIGQTALQPRYFPYPLGFPFSGAIAAAIAIAITRDVKSWPLTLAALCFAISIVTGIYYADHIANFVGGFFYPVGVRVALAFSGAFVLLFLLRLSLWLAPAAALALSTANALTVVFELPAYTASTCLMSRDAYTLILDARSLLRRVQTPNKKVFLFSDSGEELKSDLNCRHRRVPLGWIQGAIGATGFEDVAHFWRNKTVESVEPERWSEMVMAKGSIGFLTYNPARVAVLREKLEAAGGMPGDVRPYRLREGGIELSLYILPLN